VPGTENAAFPFFSPDGQSIGFLSPVDNKVKKVALVGGGVLTLADAPQLRGAVFDQDGSLLLANNSNTIITRVPAGGGAPVPVTKWQGNERLHRFPQILPGGKAILFMAHNANTDWDSAHVEVQVLSTGERKTVVRGAYAARYAAGYLFYKHADTIFAAPFSLDQLSVTGQAAPVLDGVWGSGGTGPGFAVADNGTLVAISGHTVPGDTGTIFTVDSAGRKTVLAADNAQQLDPMWSPDGKRLAYAITTTSAGDLWLRDLAREGSSRLTFGTGPVRSFGPLWTPEGRIILFVRATTSASDLGIWWLRSDGTGEAQAVPGGEGFRSTAVSPNGRSILLEKTSPTGRDLYIAPLEGLPDSPRIGKAEPFAATAAIESGAAFSPDGKWIAYSSNESGSYQIYVRPFPAGGGRHQVTTEFGRFPRWSRRELFYVGLGRRLMRVDYKTAGDTFVTGKPQPWADVRVIDRGYNLMYDVAPDGTRVSAILREKSDRPVTEINLALNFLDELKRKLP
jgi:dipeptidyl aminopeptidase/acylaminoacyl peptidase